MQALERAGMLAHSSSAGFRSRIARALKTLEKAAEQGLSPYISVSGGKDSTVMLHLARSVFPQAPALFADDEFNLPETLELLDTIPNLVRVAGRRQHAEWFTAWDNGPENVPEGTHWIEDIEGDSRMNTWAKAEGHDAACIGVRAQENWYRRIYIAKYAKKNGGSPLAYIKKRDMWHIYPVGFLTVQDVWACIALHKLPYNRAYDRLTELGVPFAERRIGPFAVQSVLSSGQMGILKAGWPDEFRRFAERYPEAKGYV